MNDDKLSVSTSNLIKCAFYWRYLNFRTLLNEEIEPTKANDYCLAINITLEQRIYNLEERRLFIRQMKQALGLQLIPQQQLEWLNQMNERSHFWMWCYCRLLTVQRSYEDNENDSYTLNCDSNASYLYSQLGLSLNPRTTKERQRLVIDFLDQSDIPLTKKLSLLEYFKAHVGQLFSIGKFTWINREDNELYQQYGWAYNYITSNKEYPIPHWFIPTPTTDREMLDVAIAAFDICPADNSTKQLIILRMKKAWSQKKHRASLEKKKKQSYNFTLSTKVKKMLDRMAESKGQSRNEILEQLIKAEYLK